MTAAQVKYVLAIDMGSGSVKASVVSSNGEVAASGLRHMTMKIMAGGGAEHDPEEWWKAACDAAREALKSAHIAPENVIAVACTTLWSVTVPVDKDGNALGNAISWMDTRGGKYNRAISAGWPKVQGYALAKLIKWVRHTGGVPVLSGVDGLGHILFMKHERPEMYARTYKFLEPMDYFNARLTGQIAASYATMFPYWLTDIRDPNRIDYVPELIAMAGLDRAKLPDLKPVDAILGTLKPEVAADLGLLPSTRVVMGAGDSHAATVGAGSVRDFQGYFYIGTTSWMSCHVPAKKIDPFHMMTAMPAALPGRYMISAEQGAAGRCIELLKDLLYSAGANTHDDVYADMNRLAAETAPGSDGLIFTPWINGVFAPQEDVSTRSAFFNQTARTTRGHYVRAVMEGVACNLRWVKRHVEKFIGRPFEQLNFIGGGASSNLWSQILADVLGCPVRQVANPRNANGVGAAMAAFAALGEISIDDISSRVKIAVEYRPTEANRSVYDRQFHEFLAFYKANRAIYRRLNPPASIRQG
ncbi:MAG TPA: FGGY-family carbohydrate kinase [Candidatus Binataceae bacterium]|nr:FGGY-family carbohydrate kinase [Candidatus Binataceae bacterium]